MEEKELLKTKKNQKNKRKKTKGTVDYIDRQIWMFIRIENLWHEFLVSNIFHNLSIIE
jgi:triacylglycerol esterase/lipase EstA (alpha/beta hydrolase family)